MGKKNTHVVAGAAGLIGYHLAEALLKRGDTVIGVDNFVTGSPQNIEDLRRFKRFRFMDHNIAQLLKIRGPVDFVFDFACPASPVDFERLATEIIQAGCFGVFNLLEFARQKEAIFVFSSSSEVYGDPRPDEHPQRETYWGNVNCRGRRAVYDESKRYGETLLTVFHRTYGVETRTVRIFNTYGERMRSDDGRAIPTFIVQALRNEDITIFGNGTQTRSIQHVSDLVRGVLLLAESDVREPINLGNPIEMSILDLAQTIKRLTDSCSKIVFQRPLPENDPNIRRPDISRAGELLGWKPLVSPEEGLKRIINWFRRGVL